MKIDHICIFGYTVNKQVQCAFKTRSASKRLDSQKFGGHLAMLGIGLSNLLCRNRKTESKSWAQENL